MEQPAKRQTFDSLFREIEEAGWLVNNLFQWSAEPKWQCNLRNPKEGSHTEYAYGRTALEALQNVVADMRRRIAAKQVDSNADEFDGL